MKKLLFCTVFLLVLIIEVSYSEEVPFTQDDRERLIKIETTLKEFKESVDKRFADLREDMNKRFEQVDKRFEQVDKRFEQVDKRFEQVDKRFEEVENRFNEILNVMWMLITAFGGITAVTIGFALWDRRTMIKPFESKVKNIEEELSKDRQKLHEFIKAFQTLAKKDEKVAEVFKQLNLL